MAEPSRDELIALINDLRDTLAEVDFLLKCVAKDLSSFQAFITNILTAAKNVASVKSSLVIRPTKREPGIPIEGK